MVPQKTNSPTTKLKDTEIGKMPVISRRFLVKMINDLKGYKQVDTFTPGSGRKICRMGERAQMLEVQNPISQIKKKIVQSFRNRLDKAEEIYEDGW